eukprot:scaffold27073_cov62-Phaeocystis_antarctica.AAC.1
MPTAAQLRLAIRTAKITTSCCRLWFRLPQSREEAPIVRGFSHLVASGEEGRRGDCAAVRVARGSALAATPASARC